jgi:glycosyltransferase involved in cell wall biosynthesis
LYPAVVRILVDYRPALRQRTGVGEYIHQLVKAYTASHTEEEVLLFTSSWKDRPLAAVSADTGAGVIDRRIPVSILNYLWHRREWPPVEMLAGDIDVAHSAHPLLMPARRAAQVVTIHDLFFLSSADQTRAEMRRDYPSLAASHAQRAHAVITSTEYGRSQIVTHLRVQADRIYVCPPGAPTWNTLGREPNVPEEGCILFLGTLEPRKNIGVLLDAYARTLARRQTMPRLVLAGRATEAASQWLARLRSAPLAGHVEHLGYVDDTRREQLLQSARVLVMPSLDEGFGLPVLEAMSAGVPVIVSSRGSLPEVVGDAGAQVDPADVDALADAIERAVTDRDWAMQTARTGLRRARAFSWQQSAETLHQAYRDAVARRTGSRIHTVRAAEGLTSPKRSEGG